MYQQGTEASKESRQSDDEQGVNIPVCIERDDGNPPVSGLPFNAAPGGTGKGNCVAAIA